MIPSVIAAYVLLYSGPVFYNMRSTDVRTLSVINVTRPVCFVIDMIGGKKLVWFVIDCKVLSYKMKDLI